MQLDLSLADDSAGLSASWQSTLLSFRAGTPDLPAASAMVDALGGLVSRSPGLPVARNWSAARAWLRALVARREMVAAAASGGDVATARHRLAALVTDLPAATERIAPRALRPRLAAAADPTAGTLDERRAVRALASLPLPSLYLGVERDRFARGRGPARPAAEASGPPVLKLTGSLDTTPLVTPQSLKPGWVYTLGFRVKGACWPADATSLLIRLLTICPPDVCTPPALRVARPDADGGFDVRAAGPLRFASPQSALSDDLVFTAQCLFEGPGGELTEAPVVGHNELRFRASDSPVPGVDTGNSQVDLHLAKLLGDLRAAAPSVEPELPDLLRVLEALVMVIGTFAQEGLFKERADVTEKEFQRETTRAMRMRLGSEVREHESQAGGILDVRYRGVVVELKVEKHVVNRQTLANKYTAQATQYAGAAARQVSVVFVLDLTEKRRPPGDIRSDVMLVDVPTHGGPDSDKSHPSKAFVLVLNGNTRSPSYYS